MRLAGDALSAGVIGMSVAMMDGSVRQFSSDLANNTYLWGLLLHPKDRAVLPPID